MKINLININRIDIYLNQCVFETWDDWAHFLIKGEDVHKVICT